MAWLIVIIGHIGKIKVNGVSRTHEIIHGCFIRVHVVHIFNFLCCVGCFAYLRDKAQFQFSSIQYCICLIHCYTEVTLVRVMYKMPVLTSKVDKLIYCIW